MYSLMAQSLHTRHAIYCYFQTIQKQHQLVSGTVHVVGQFLWYVFTQFESFATHNMYMSEQRRVMQGYKTMEDFLRLKKMSKCADFVYEIWYNEHISTMTSEQIYCCCNPWSKSEIMMFHGTFPLIPRVCACYVCTFCSMKERMWF